MFIFFVGKKTDFAYFWKYLFYSYHFLDVCLSGWGEIYPFDWNIFFDCSIIYDFNPCVPTCFCRKYVFLNVPLMLSLA